LDEGCIIEGFLVSAGDILKYRFCHSHVRATSAPAKVCSMIWQK